MIATCTRIRAH